MVRISVDIWFTYLLTNFGLDALSATFFIAAAIGAYIVFTKRDRLKSLKLRYFGLMIVECTVYAIALAFLIHNALNLLFLLDGNSSLHGLSKLQLFALSLGAGLYEELFFRVILVSLLFYLFNKFVTGKTKTYILSAIIAALIFSGVHYIGEYGDSWSLSSFLFRFLFGLGLNVIYVKRGFGSAAWTHAIYDIIVVFGR